MAATSIPEPTYLTLSARPVRTGVLVSELEGIPWRAVFVGALASQARVWGGTQNLVFPLGDYPPVGTDCAQSDLFWALVSLFDPDWWCVYTGNVADLAELDRGAYEREVAGIAARHADLPPTRPSMNAGVPSRTISQIRRFLQGSRRCSSRAARR